MTDNMPEISSNAKRRTGPVPAGAAAEAPLGQSYWQIVWRQFRKRWLAMTGLAMVFFLFALAVFAPFLANKYPYYWYTPQEGLSLPVVQALTNLDVVLLLAFALGMLVPVTRQVIRWTGWRFWALHEMRRAVSANFLLFALAASLVVAFRVAPGRLFVEKEGMIERDFKAEAQDPSVRCLFPPIPFSPHDTDLARLNQPPGGEHVLGTDRVGRSVAARVVYGARTSLAVGFVAVGISLVIGILVGGVSAYFGRAVDLAVQRVVEIFICFPTLFLILFIVAMFGSKLWLIMVAIGVTGWTGISRFIRAEILKIKTLDYITAARALGLRPLRIILRHAVPNSMGPVLVSATFGVAIAILLEAGLSFLGLGDPDQPSWGLLLSQAQSVAHQHPKLLFVPGATIFFAVLAYNLVGEGLRDAIDPRLKI